MDIIIVTATEFHPTKIISMFRTDHIHTARALWSKQTGKWHTILESSFSDENYLNHVESIDNSVV